MAEAQVNLTCFTHYVLVVFSFIRPMLPQTNRGARTGYSDSSSPATKLATNKAMVAVATVAVQRTEASVLFRITSGPSSNSSYIVT